jgi:thiol-disulfide isomerase/thioredoxin
MKITQKTIFFSILIILALGAVLTYIIGGSEPKVVVPGKYDELAVCLKDKGAVFYGAFWCTHCQSQKKLFESSAKLLPYVECSTADGQGQLQVCKDKKIEGYPTWIFADGSTLNGEVPLSTLAEKTSCALPI